MKTCSSDGLSSSLYDDCTSAEYRDDAMATCQPLVCTPGEPACNGNIATTCNAEGVARLVDNLQPQHISWWARVGQSNLSSTYFLLQADDAGSDRLFSMYFRYTGYLRNYVDSYTSYEVPYAANVWYHIELRNIDWTAGPTTYT